MSLFNGERALWSVAVGKTIITIITKARLDAYYSYYLLLGFLGILGNDY